MEGENMSAAALIISGIISATTAIVSGVSQKRALGRAEAKESAMYDVDTKTEEKRYQTSLKMSKDAIREDKRRYEEEKAMTLEGRSYNRFQEQSQKMASLFNQNEQLKDLYINRLRGLRGA
jgi:hypothetical protein